MREKRKREKRMRMRTRMRESTHASAHSTASGPRGPLQARALIAVPPSTPTTAPAATASLAHTKPTQRSLTVEAVSSGGGENYVYSRVYRREGEKEREASIYTVVGQLGENQSTHRNGCGGYHAPYEHLRWISPRTQRWTSRGTHIYTKCDNLHYTRIYESDSLRCTHTKHTKCDGLRSTYDNKTFQLVVASRGITYEPCPPYAHH
ncbi:hypothetical protein BDD12DRAFT_482228 [Trichophaea hybrida]|nr:hypothetical protein BDD12DRAFT_482228 [Trichophaea hybrida]